LMSAILGSFRGRRGSRSTRSLPMAAAVDRHAEHVLVVTGRRRRWSGYRCRAPACRGHAPEGIRAPSTSRPRSPRR
jgi:hypothetical protein